MLSEILGLQTAQTATGVRHRQLAVGRDPLRGGADEPATQTRQDRPACGCDPIQRRRLHTGPGEQPQQPGLTRRQPGALHSLPHPPPHRRTRCRVDVAGHRSGNPYLQRDLGAVQRGARRYCELETTSPTPPPATGTHRSPLRSRRPAARATHPIGPAHLNDRVLVQRSACRNANPPGERPHNNDYILVGPGRCLQPKHIRRCALLLRRSCWTCGARRTHASSTSPSKSPTASCEQPRCYRRTPQTDEEDRWAQENAIAIVEEEPG